MALDPRKRQKKLERKNAKQRSRRREIATRSGDLTDRFRRVGDAPVRHCCVTKDIFDKGMGQLLLSRGHAGGPVAFVVFLLDTYCLGVKDVTLGVQTDALYVTQLYNKLLNNFEMLNLKPECGRNLVEGAVEYAQALGLPPHRDYQKASAIFGDLDPAACTQSFTYGRDGKPFFAAGPYDNPGRCERILRTLCDHVGPDGFHYMLPFEVPATIRSVLEGDRVRIDGGSERLLGDEDESMPNV